MGWFPICQIPPIQMAQKSGNPKMACPLGKRTGRFNLRAVSWFNFVPVQSGPALTSVQLVFVLPDIPEGQKPLLKQPGRRQEFRCSQNHTLPTTRIMVCHVLFFLFRTPRRGRRRPRRPGYDWRGGGSVGDMETLGLSACKVKGHLG